MQTIRFELALLRRKAPYSLLARSTRAATTTMPRRQHPPLRSTLSSAQPPKRSRRTPQLHRRGSRWPRPVRIELFVIGLMLTCCSGFVRQADADRPQEARRRPLCRHGHPQRGVRQLHPRGKGADFERRADHRRWPSRRTTRATCRWPRRQCQPPQPRLVTDCRQLWLTAAQEYKFVLDPFQREAVKCLERNEVCFRSCV